MGTPLLSTKLSVPPLRPDLVPRPRLIERLDEALMTCSALTAGIMVLGLMRGEIENSHLRVLRMLGKMAVRGDAFADDVNAFNKIMNRGNRLAHRFKIEFGSTQCRAITQCDFATIEGVQRYIKGGGTARCSALAQSVAHRVLGMIQPAAAA